MIEFDQTSLSLSDFDRCSSTESFSECSLTLSPKLLPYCNDLDTFERCHNIGFSGNCKHFQPEPGVDLSQYGIKYDIKCNTDEEICSNGAGLSGATRVGTEPDCKAYVVFCGRTTGVFRSWTSAVYQIKNFPGGRLIGYSTLSDAELAWIHAPECHTSSDCLSPGHQYDIEKGPLIPHTSLTPAPFPHKPPSPKIVQTPTSPQVPCSPALDICEQPMSSFSQVSDTLTIFPTPGPIRFVPPEYISDEDAWWIVVVGDLPGVYLGKSTARKASGVNGHVLKVGDAHLAWAIYFANHMSLT